MTAWNFGNAEYGTPPPRRKQSTIWSSTVASRPMYCIPVARLFIPAARVSQAAWSAGSANVPVAPSCSTIRLVVITASHSLTYRSSSAAFAAISALVAAGIPAMTSNSPVRWPTLTISASAASFIVPIIRSANSFGPLAHASGTLTPPFWYVTIPARPKTWRRKRIHGCGNDLNLLARVCGVASGAVRAALPMPPGQQRWNIDAARTAPGRLTMESRGPCRRGLRSGAARGA